jgi:large subunit ribosomal protein L28
MTIKMLEKYTLTINIVNLRSLRRNTAMAKCEICGKSIQIGNSVSHSNKKTRKIWRPNVKLVRVLENKRPVKKYVCTRCIRSGKIQKAV